MEKHIQKYTAFLSLGMILFQTILPGTVFAGNEDEIIYPLKQISKLECRFEDFGNLGSDCKEDLPVLKTKDYTKYISQNGGYNDFTRTYTVLWGSSYKYGWDVGNGGHEGTDIATAKGTPVYSIANGEVIKTGEDVGWGKYVSIEHTIRGKKIVSNYAHLSQVYVDEGDSIKVGKKIGEVGSTGNSTGNHLHFQIDLPHLFHPYYYDWNTCPYSYYEISESDVCFNELAANTLDPLAFLESNGAILDAVQVVEKTSTSSSTNTKNSYDYSIFSVTVSPEDGSVSQIKQVQQIYKDLGYYNGAISGTYTDLEESLINYQIQTGVISSRESDGAGWFGPKTRTQTKKDYVAYIATGKVATQVVQEATETISTPTIQKVSRVNLLTREEIEAMEVQEFLKKYNIDLNDTLSQISENTTKTTTLSIKDNRGRGFRGNTPGNVSFEFDSSKISVFPEKFYNFSNGLRDIKITGKQAGHTTLNIKIGDVIVKTLSISIGKTGDTPQPESGKIYSDGQAVLGDTKTAIVLLKDQYGNKLVKSRYNGNFEILSQDDIQFCVKRGTIQDLRALYKRKCLDEEFSNTLSFTYDDTVGGLLIFDYKIQDTQSAGLELKMNDTGKTLAQATIKTQVPTGLTAQYEYFNEVIQSLSLGLTSGLRNGYFLEKNGLSQYDTNIWLGNTIRNMQNSDMKEKLAELQHRTNSKSIMVSRKEFLGLVSYYIGANQISSNTKIYKDLSEGEEALVANLLGDTYTWKDSFGENYFQPEKNITRGEATYLLLQALEKQGHGFLVRK